MVFEFKSAIRDEATLYSAFEQLNVRYKRDIPALLKYNALCVSSDGVNNKMGSLFASYEFFYAWRKDRDNEAVAQVGISSLHTMVQGCSSPASSVWRAGQSCGGVCRARRAAVCS